MRCKKHYSDLSSSNGVCASCLRQRLFSLIAAQSQSQSQVHQLENQQVFPRSVSPYITRRKSDNSAAPIDHRINSDRNQRFFSTPQVGPTVTSHNNINVMKKKKRNSFIRFSLISNLFRSKNKKPVSVSVSDPRLSYSVTNSATSAMSSPSRFSNIISGASNRKKQSTISGEIRQQYLPDRGMSPARYSDYGGVEDEFRNESSDYESCDSRKQTPWLTPAHPTVRRGSGGVGGGGGGGARTGKSVSGLTFCLSPLIRASPCRNWNQKGISPVVDGGDIRAPVMPHFCANRSRKLADFGRFNTNR